MELVTIPPDSLSLRVYRIWEHDWFLLTSGDFAKGHYNTMTVAWGSLGSMWSKPFAMVVVRPQRYTHEFMEKYPDFTLSSFPSAHRKALNLLGSTSGRKGDKIAKSGLTPCAATTVGSPTFAEASLIIECRTMYRDTIDPAGFVDPAIVKNYATRDFHSVYFGEIVVVRGTEEHLSE